MWLETVYTFLYYFSLMYLPWLLLMISVYLFVVGVAFESLRRMIIGFLVFLPNLIALLFLDIEPLLYMTLLLPFFQVVLAIRYYRQEKVRTKA
ncbi:hypothetical protein GPDM_06725 [Planococcus donghaensis MPA1U2]|uniref:Uncharacterized protein n=1 Tax=Planococcus donghaensis MPA1U2 TaxID=933115 RepID=E7RFU7_9BACL|nr:hypothetical protein GPDM_06725 [Planococcus donghaensis MPA1U2]